MLNMIYTLSYIGSVEETTFFFLWLLFSLWCDCNQHATSNHWSHLKLVQLQSQINLEVHFPSWLLLQDKKAKWGQEEILNDMKKSAYRLL